MMKDIFIKPPPKKKLIYRRNKDLEIEKVNPNPHQIFHGKLNKIRVISDNQFSDKPSRNERNGKLVMNSMSNDYIKNIVDAPVNQTVKLKNNNKSKINLEENRSITE